MPLRLLLFPQAHTLFRDAASCISMNIQAHAEKATEGWVKHCTHVGFHVGEVVLLLASQHPYVVSSGATMQPPVVQR